MKKIEAIIRKTKFEDVKEALLAADIEWFSYYDVRGEGKMRQARIYRGVMYDTSSIERVLLNIVVRDKNVEKTINAIQEAARTGEATSPSIMPSRRNSDSCLVFTCKDYITNKGHHKYFKRRQGIKRFLKVFN